MRYEDMEYVNYQHILNCIEHELILPSRADVAKHLGLSRTTLSTIANNMIGWGLLTEGKGISVSRGRPGNPLMIDSSRWKVIGAAFYIKSWHFVLCDLMGTILETYHVELDSITPESLVDTLIEGLLYMKNQYPENLLPAVGIGVPGVVDIERGDILFAHDLAWHDRIHIKSVVEEAIGMQAYIRNRYWLAGLAEYKYANPDKEKNVIYIGIGSGISCAIVVDGHMLVGDSFCAGRIAHIQVDPDGPLCNCGKRGCLLTVANEHALKQYVLDALNHESVDSKLNSFTPEQISVATIGKAADEGDLFAQSCLDHILSYVTKVISMLVDTINPKTIIIGGPIGYSSSYFVSQIDRALRAYPDYPPAKNLSIRQGSLHENGAALGAASLVLDNKLELLYQMNTSK